MTVAELGRRMSSAELVEWVAFYRLEHKLKSGVHTPEEFDDPEQHSEAIDALFRRF